MKEALLDIVRYCYPHSEQMWAARVISIALECDFRDAKRYAEIVLSPEEN